MGDERAKKSSITQELEMGGVVQLQNQGLRCLS